MLLIFLSGDPKCQRIGSLLAAKEHGLQEVSHTSYPPYKGRITLNGYRAVMGKLESCGLKKGIRRIRIETLNNTGPPLENQHIEFTDYKPLA